ncbi:MAG TPA: hypothetical protein VK619_05105 [Pyrinomonadaceae bacterium]|nr:hypothetical protein [Pyrinomonadaceae bacterium]
MELRLAILAKNDLLALISMVKTEDGARITTLDPRREQPMVKTYEPWLVAHEFVKVISLSLKNGWRILYDGPQLLG